MAGETRAGEIYLLSAIAGEIYLLSDIAGEICMPAKSHHDLKNVFHRFGSIFECFRTF